MTQGAVRVFEIDGSACFRRFTDEQEELYRISNEEFWKKTFSTAGIKLCFETNSEIMNLSVLALESTSRTYFSLDIFQMINLWERSKIIRKILSQVIIRKFVFLLDILKRNLFLVQE